MDSHLVEWGRRGANLLLQLTALGCLGGCAIQDRDLRAPTDDGLRQAERAAVVEREAERARVLEQSQVQTPRAREGLARALPAGRCLSQQDCGPAQVCVATRPGLSECLSGSEHIAPRNSPHGRPTPPAGLLDGRVLREHVASGPRP